MMTEDKRIVCAEDDTIDVLGLTARVYNALRRSRVHTIGELLEVHNADKLFEIRNMGEKSVAEIEEKLANITVISSSPLPPSIPPFHDQTNFGLANDLNVIIDRGPPRLPKYEM